MKITHIRTNSQGHISFSAMFTGMRKSQEFTVYSGNETKYILIKSLNRCGLVADTGIAEIALVPQFSIFSLVPRRRDTVDNIDELIAEIEKKKVKNETKI